MKFHAILCDLDGTLLDTLDDLADSANAALGELGYPARDRELYKYFVGDGIRNLGIRAISYGSNDPVAPEQVEKFVKLMGAEYDRRWDAKTKPYPGAPELLDALTSRGVKLGVLSNKPHAFTKIVVERLLPRWKFDAVFGARDGVAIKPDPAGALEALEAMGARAEATLYLGDTATDMKTAKAAGMFAAGALWGFRDREELTSSGADVIVATPGDVIKLFE